MAFLIIQNGAVAGRTMTQQKRFLRIGHSLANDHQLPEPSVSDTHCEVPLDGAGHLIVLSRPCRLQRQFLVRHDPSGTLRSGTRVGPGWHALSAPARRALANLCQKSWRRTAPVVALVASIAA